MPEKNLFGNLLKNDNMYKASEIVEEIGAKVPDRKIFYSSSPTMSWGSAVGYIPGTMELLYGPKSSGKTMIALDRMKHVLAQDPNTIAIFVDAELNFEYESTVRWMAANGVPTDRVMILRDVCIKKIFEEEILGKIQLECKAGNIQLAYIAMDSIQAMSVKNIPETEKQISKASKPKDSYTKQDHGARANFISRIFPFYRMFCRDYRVFTTFIGQARDGGKDFFGNQIWVTNGGEALYHEVQYRTLVTPAGEPVFDKGQQDADGNAVKVGHRIKFLFEKNKMGEGHDRKGFCDIEYMKGIVNAENELAALVTKMGIVEQKGTWIHHKDQKFQGVAQFTEFLRNNPSEFQDLYNQVMQRASTQPTEQISFEEELGEKNAK